MRRLRAFASAQGLSLPRCRQGLGLRLTPDAGVHSGRASRERGSLGGCPREGEADEAICRQYAQGATYAGEEDPLPSRRRRGRSGREGLGPPLMAGRPITRAPACSSLTSLLVLFVYAMSLRAYLFGPHPQGVTAARWTPWRPGSLVIGVGNGTRSSSRGVSTEGVSGDDPRSALALNTDDAEDSPRQRWGAPPQRVRP